MFLFFTTVQGTDQRDLPVPLYEARRRRLVQAHQQGVAPHRQAKWLTSPQKDQYHCQAQPKETLYFKEKARVLLHSILNCCECNQQLLLIIIIILSVSLFISLLFVLPSVYTYDPYSMVKLFTL